MEIVTLNSNYQPESTVESYSSAIWTERYAAAGDFEIHGTNINELMNQMPLESVISLRESTVPMVVEVYKIEKKKNSAPEITITGRSMETVLERRAAVRTPLAEGTVRTAWMTSATSTSDAAYNAIRRVLGDTPRYQNGVAILPSLSPAVSPNDAIPDINPILPADYQIAVWDSTISYFDGNMVGYGTGVYQATSLSPNVGRVPGVDVTYWTQIATVPSGTAWGTANSIEITPGDLYNTVLELLATNNHGIKATRPGAGGSKVDVEIYNGADLTTQVVFDARLGQIDESTYLLTETGSADVAYVYGPTGGSLVKRNTSPEPSGLSRRVLLDDLVSESSVNSADARKSRGLIDIYQNNPTALFSGEVAVQVAAGYNVSYFLGDIIRLDGEYGLSEFARVSEFIRSDDDSGEKAYPTFEAIV